MKFNENTFYGLKVIDGNATFKLKLAVEHNSLNVLSRNMVLILCTYYNQHLYLNKTSQKYLKESKSYQVVMISILQFTKWHRL